MIGAIVGNGPSKHLFKPSAYDFVIGCNIPGIRVDATVIMDEEIIHILAMNPNLIDCPIIISNKANLVLQKYKTKEYFQILNVFDVKNDSWWNSAHYAASYLISLGCIKIDIWGCDSIFNDTLLSSTDLLVKKDNTTDARFYRNWRRVWKEIFANNPSIKFEVKTL